LLLSLTSGGFVCKIGKQEGCFWKKGYKRRGSLIKWEEREGLKAKWPLIPFLLTRNRGGGQGRRRRPIRPLRASGAAGTGGKGREGCGGSIPSLTSSWGAAQRRLGGSGRQWTERFAAAALLRLGRRRAAAVTAWGVEERRRRPLL